MSILFEISLLNITQDSEKELVQVLFSHRGVAYSLTGPGSIFVRAVTAEEEISIEVSGSLEQSVLISSILSPSEIRISESVKIGLQAVQIEPDTQRLSSLFDALTEANPFEELHIQGLEDDSFQQVKELFISADTQANYQHIQDLAKSSNKKEQVTQQCITEMHAQIEKLKKIIKKNAKNNVSFKSKLKEYKKTNLELRRETELLKNEEATNHQSTSCTSNSHTPNSSRMSCNLDQLDQKLQELELMVQKYEEDKKQLISENSKLKTETVTSKKTIDKKSKLLKENKLLEQKIKSLNHMLSALKTSFESSNNDIVISRQKQNDLKDILGEKDTELKEYEHKISCLSKTLEMSQKNSTKNKMYIEHLKAQAAISKANSQSNINSIKAYYTQLIDFLKSELSKKHKSTVEASQNYKEIVALFKSENTSLKSSIDRLTKDISEKLLKKESLEQEKLNLIEENKTHKERPQDNLSELQVLTNQLSANENKSEYFLKELSEITQVMSISSQRTPSSSSSSQLLSLESILSQKDIELARLRRIIKKYKTIHPNYVPVENDPIDQSLADFINNLDEPLDVQFMREDRGIYFYGHKRVFIRVDGFKIIIRVGDRFILVDEFINEFPYDQLHKLDELGEKKEEKQRYYSREDSKIPMSKRGSTPNKGSLSRSFFKGASQIGQITRPSII